MASIKDWSQTPANNNASPPNGAPEGWHPSSVNNTVRENMAAVRVAFDELPYVIQPVTPTRVDNDTFTVATNLTTTYYSGRRVKLVGATTGYATIASSSYSAPDTTVNVTMDSGNVPTSLTYVSLGFDTDNAPTLSTAIEYPITAAELSASVTPVNYYYQSVPLDTRRLNDVGDGTDVTAKIAQAVSVAALSNGFGTFQNKADFMPGYHNITSGVTITAGQTIEGCGATNTKLEANYASSTGAPMLSLSTGPDFTLQRMRVEGNAKASGLLLTDSPNSIIFQAHFNSMGFSGTNGAYGYKSTESASLLLGCSFYYYNNAADIAALVNGGSQHLFFNSHFASRSIGIKSSTSASSGVRAWGCDFQAQYPALSIGNGESLWDIQGCYFEGESGQTAMDVISLGNYDGGGGSAQTNINFEGNQIAGSNVNDVTFHNGGTVNIHNNEMGKNVTVDVQTNWLYFTGNTFAAGKSLTDNAAFSTVEKRNESYMAASTANIEHVRSIDSTNGYTEVTYIKGRAGYGKRLMDFASALINRAGNRFLEFTSSGDFIHNLPTSVPTLSNNKDMTFTLTSNTNLRISVRGSDGVTRVANITLA